MSNPWLKKNPVMSLWLSGANTVMGSARDQASAAMKREANNAGAAMSEAAAHQVTEFWISILTMSPTVARKRRTQR